MKKVKTIFLLAVNIFILILAVLPHHHHGEMVAFFNSESCNVILHSETSLPEDTNHDEDCCSQREMFNILKCPSCNSVDPAHSHDVLAVDFLADIPFAILNIAFYAKIDSQTVDLFPYEIPLKSTFFGEAYSLRGPPSFIA